MADWTRNVSEWIRRSSRGLITLAAMGVFLSLSHSIMHVDMPPEVLGLLGTALILSGQWVTKCINSYVGKQSDDEE